MKVIEQMNGNILYFYIYIVMYCVKLVIYVIAETPKPSLQSCEGNNDPFIDIPPDLFVPPKNTPSTTLKKWKIELAASIARINRLKVT